MEKGQGKGTDTLKKDNDFVRRGDVKCLLENTVCLHEELPAQIDIIPAADVVPVKRGHWVKARGSYCTPGGDPVWECDQCGKGRHVYGIEHGSYGRDIADGQWVSCPNCGARMDGDSNGV